MKQNNDKLMDNMEYLIDEIKKEWDRSGTTVRQVKIPSEDIGEVFSDITDVIDGIYEKLKKEEMSFKDTLSHIKKAHILLRVTTKIKNCSKNADGSSKKGKIRVSIDKEESKLLLEHLPYDFN